MPKKYNESSDEALRSLHVQLFEVEDEQLPDKILAAARQAGDTNGVSVKATLKGSLFPLLKTDTDGSTIITLDVPSAHIPIEGPDREPVIITIIPALASVAIGGYFESHGQARFADGSLGYYELSSRTNRRGDEVLFDNNIFDLEIAPH